MFKPKAKSDHMKKFETSGHGPHYKVKRTKSGHIQYAPTIALQEKFQRKRNMKRTTRCFLKKKCCVLFINAAHFPKIKEQCKNVQKRHKGPHSCRPRDIPSKIHWFTGTQILDVGITTCWQCPVTALPKKTEKRCQLRKLKIERWLSFGHKLLCKSIVWFSPSRL